MRQNLGIAGPLACLLVALPVFASEQECGGRQAIRTLERLGGRVTRNDSAPGKPVVAVDLACCRFDDDDLACLKDLPSLRRLDLAFTNVMDKGIEHLKGCTRLTELQLSCCAQITDRSLEHVKALTALRRLDLSHNNFTNKGLEQLHGLTGLRYLGLAGIRISKKEEGRLRKALPKAEIDQGNGNTAQKRVRKHFAIPEESPLTSQTIRAAILARLPVGSREGQVSSFLTSAGIGKDKWSSHYPADEQGKIVCRIEYDPGSGEIVHTHYGIFFRFDDRKRLKDVEVQEWKTGP